MRKRRLKYGALFILLLTGNWLSAQPFYFDHYSSSDGLSSVVVSDIVQDSTGFLWVGTPDGLNRFDGYGFKTYKHNPKESNSLNDNLIRSLHIDQSNTLWIGTRKGAARYNEIKDEFIRLPGVLYGHENSNEVRVLKILSDKRNHIWIAMQENGIFIYDPKVKEYRHFHADSAGDFQISSNLVTGLVYDRDADIFWFTLRNGGLKRILMPEGKIEELENINASIPGKEQLLDLFRIKENGTSYLLMLGYQHLYKVPLYADSIHATIISDLPFGNYQIGINDILQTNQHEIWIGGSPLMRYNSYTEEYFPVRHSIDELYSISNDNVTSLFRDRFGVLWVGTENGLNKLDMRQKPFTYYSETSASKFRLPPGEIQAIFSDSNNTLWIGIRKRGISLFRGDSVKHIQFESNLYPGFSGNNISSFLEDSKGRLWIGVMGGGLNMTEEPEAIWNDKVRFRYFRPDQSGGRFLDTWSVRCIEEEDEYSFWVGSLKGIMYVRFREEADQLVVDSVRNYRHNASDNSSLIGNLVNDIYLDDKKNVWIATSQGLSVLRYDDRQMGRFTNFFPDSEDGRISQNSIKKILKGDENELWFATQGGGLFHYDLMKEKFTNFDAAKGFPASIVWEIQKHDRNELWLSTNEGLWNYDASNHSFTRFKTIDALFNIEFSEFSSFKSSSGELFFGGKNGLLRFHPDSIEYNREPPRVVISGLRIFNQKVEVGDTILGKVLLDSALQYKRRLVLTHQQNDFSFEFLGLHFAAPEQNEYSYIMEGYDRTWKYTGSDNRIATYTNLPPGTYTFKVKASSKDSVWSKQNPALFVKVLPPYWRSWWAYVIYLIIITGILFLVLYFAHVRQKWQNELELDKLKLRFYTNVSHELRTPLTLLLGPIENLLNQETGFEESLKMMQRNARKLNDLINQVLDIRKLEQGMQEIRPEPVNIVQFTGDIVEMFAPLAGQKDYILSFRPDRGSHIINIDKEKFEVVLVNLISNAFKYTSPGGKIWVEINTKKKKRTEISVSDSGIGISRSNLSRVFEHFYTVDQNPIDGYGIGLALSNELIRLHHGEIKVESRSGQGSCFTVTIPNDLPAVETNTKKEDSGYLPHIAIEEYSQTEENDENLQSGRPILLVIDDHADMRNYLRDQLADKYQVFLAENGAKGVDIAFDIIPDLIISDVMMPGLDGFKLTSALKKDIRTSHIPIILLTARKSSESQVSGLKTGADDYISKPFSFELLDLRIHNLLENRKRAHRFFKRMSNAEELDGLEIEGFDKTFLNKAFKAIHENFESEEFSVEEFAGMMSLSRTQLYRKIKALTGNTPVQLIKNVRMNRAAELLRSREMTVSETAYKTGFKDIAHFSRSFREFFGRNPSDFMKGP